MSEPHVDSPHEEGISSDLWYIGYLLSNTGSGITTPLIPLFLVYYLNANVFDLGLTTSVASVASVIALIFWGNLSDFFRKRKIFILIGFVGSFASLLLILIVHDLAEYILVLVLFQIVSMASVPISTLILIENSEQRRWATVLSKFNTVASVGTVLGLVAGTALITFLSANLKETLVLIYEVSGAFYLAGAIAVSAFVKEPRRILKRQWLWKISSVRIWERMRYFPASIIHIINIGMAGHKKPLGKDLKLYLLGSTTLMLGFQMFMVPYPLFLIERMGADEFAVFMMYLANAVIAALTYRLSGKSINRFGSRKVLVISVLSRIVIFLAMVPFAIFASMGAEGILITIGIYGALGGIWSFIGISQVNSVSLMAKSEERGKAIGYYNSFNGVGQIIGSLISGFVALYYGFGLAFLASAAVVIVGLSLALKSLPAEKTPKASLDAKSSGSV